MSGSKFNIIKIKLDARKPFTRTSKSRLERLEQVLPIESNGEALLIFNKLKLARTDETLKIIKFSKRLTAKILEVKYEKPQA